MARSKRRANGEGTIAKRKDGRWEGRLSIPGGRIVVYGRTKVEAARKLAKKKAEQLSGTLTTPSKETLGGWLDHWLHNIQARAVAASTLGQQRWLARKHVRPHLGDHRLTQLRPEHFDWLLGELERGNVGARTRQQVHALLRRSLRKAVEKRRLTVNPMDAVEAPRAARPEIQAYEIGEVRKLLEKAAGDPYEALYILAVNTGMRWGEIAGLQWRDVDLGRGVVHVRRAQCEVYDPDGEKGRKWRVELGEPKSKSSRRAIRIGQSVVAALKAHQVALGASPLPNVRVFTAPGGASLRRSNFLRKQWHPLLVRAELTKRGFHSLRHTMATTGLTQGLHPKVVQERLGHSRVSLTLDTYSDVIPELHEEAADILEAALLSETDDAGAERRG